MSDALSIWPAVAAVFAASLAGSLHCAGMCGGLALFAIGADGRPARRWPMHAGYHGGRLLSYAALGAAAGAIGGLLDGFGAGAVAAWQRPAAIAAGVLLALWGAAGIARELGARWGSLSLPPAYQRLVERGHAAAFRLRPAGRAWAVGVLTPLLPCGWLYAFAIAAGGTGSAAFGAMTMAVFWLGTMPVMGSLGAGLGLLSERLKRRLPLITAVTVLAVGLWTVFGRVAAPAIDPAELAATHPTLGEAMNDADRDGADPFEAIDPDAVCPLCTDSEGGGASS